jgi:hypothetical protein
MPVKRNSKGRFVKGTTRPRKKTSSSRKRRKKR